MKTKTKLKNLKPIDVDAHLQYRCPKPDCGYDHWLSLKQTQTKNFKIVCDCGFVFKPKRIKSIEIKYEEAKNQKDIKPKEAKSTENILSIDTEQKCVKLLTDYGFTKNESLVLIKKSFEANQSDDPSVLVKYILKNLEKLNEQS